MRLKKLCLENFLCFGKVELDFYKYSDSVLILGDNRDMAGTDSNESGKSSLLDSIPWILFGEVPSKILSDDVIRRGCVGCVGEVVFDGDHEYRIVRKRGKGVNLLKLYVDGEDRSLRVMKQTQEELLGLFGMNMNSNVAFVDFFNSVYFSAGVVDAFASVSMTSGRRLELISRFLNLDRIDDAIVKARKGYSDYEKELIGIDGKIGFLKERMVDVDIGRLKLEVGRLKRKIGEVGELKSSKERILDLFRAVSEGRNRIEQLKEKREIYVVKSENYRNELREKYRSLKEERDAILVERDKLVDIIDKIEILQSKHDEYASVENELNEVLSLCDEVGRELEELNEQKSHYDRLLRDSEECPECGIPLFVDEGKIVKFDRNRVEKLLKECDLNTDMKLEEQSKLSEKMNGLRSMLDGIEFDGLESLLSEKMAIELRLGNRLPQIENELVEIDQKGVSDKKELEKRLHSIDVEIDNEVEKNERMMKEIGSYVEQDVVLEVDRLAVEIESLKEELHGKLRDIDDYMESKNALALYDGKRSKIQNDVNRYLKWKEAFPYIRKNMIYLFLPDLERVANKYLSLLEVGVEVLFDLDFARVNNELAISIDDGVGLWKFDQRSRGMQSRVALAIGLGLGELARFDRAVPFDFRLMDEVVDSLDATGVELFFDLLPEVPGQKFFVSHDAGLKKKFDVGDVITVVKEDGVSRVG